MADKWMIVGNVSDPTSGARLGALCDLVQIAVPRVRVRALSVGGRKIEFWTVSERIEKWRVKWCPPDQRLQTWDNKDEAQAVADRLNQQNGNGPGNA